MTDVSRERAQKRRRSKAWRFFSCTLCNHKVRFGSERCGNCGTPTPLLNRKDVLFLVVPTSVGGILFFLA